MSWIEADNADRPSIFSGVLIGGALICGAVIGAFCNAQYAFGVKKVSIRARAALMVQVFRQSLLLREDARKGIYLIIYVYFDTIYGSFLHVFITNIVT